MKSKLTFLILLILSAGLGSCQAETTPVQVTPEVVPTRIPAGMTAREAATLASLEQVDDYPLYTMVYQADYSDPQILVNSNPDLKGRSDWACSLFTAFADPNQALYGRNFDWDFSPGLLLFTDPEEGYASVSMVDLYYLGFGYERSYGLSSLPLEELEGLLDAPYLPFDGMNEAGLAIGMAAVPDGGVPPDPEKETIDSLLVIRKVLDGAATINEAVEIIRTYNIDWGSGPALHYLIAEAGGRSVLIEFSRGEISLIENQEPWQAATNFLLSEAWAEPENHCWRYGAIAERLEDSGGTLSPREAMNLLEDVSQENTQWSVIYQINEGEVWIAMGRKYRNYQVFDVFP